MKPVRHGVRKESVVESDLEPAAELKPSVLQLPEQVPKDSLTVLGSPGCDRRRS